MGWENKCDLTALQCPLSEAEIADVVTRAGKFGQADISLLGSKSLKFTYRHSLYLL